MTPTLSASTALPPATQGSNGQPSRSFRFHGLWVRITAAADVLAALGARLAEFPETATVETPAMRFEFHPIADARSRAVQRPVGQGRSVVDLVSGSVEYFEKSDELFVDFGTRGRALCALRTREVWVAYPGNDPRSVWLCSHPLFTIPLAELLKRSGLYMVHAAGLTHEGRGLLVAGASGAGKTTLCLALLRAGFGFLADDTVFLSNHVNGGAGPHGQPCGLRVLAFPDEVDLTEQTAGFFPELKPDAGEPPAHVRPKRAVCATRLYGVAPQWECQPAMLVFPQQAPVPQSVLTPMSKEEAFLQLLCNVVRTDVDASQAHLNALSTLVQQCHCFRLRTGRDFEALPSLLRSALEQTTAPPTL
jgi:hypothetical protein